GVLKCPIGGITSSVMPGFKVSLAQVENSPPGVRLISTRNTSSCTAEQIEYERRTSSPLIVVRSVRCCPCTYWNLSFNSGGTANVTAMVSRVSLITLATDSG